MIYTVQWVSICRQHTVSEWNQSQFPNNKVGDVVGDIGGNDFAEFVRKSKNSAFVIALSNYAGEQGQALDQKPQFDKWVEDQGMQEYVKFVSAGISNPVHQERKYSVYLAILQSKDHETPVELKGMVQ